MCRPYSAITVVEIHAYVVILADVTFTHRYHIEYEETKGAG